MLSTKSSMTNILVNFDVKMKDNRGCFFSTGGSVIVDVVKVKIC